MKDVINFFKKTSKTDRGKGIWFFVAFAFLLLILMVISRTTTHYPLEDQLNDIRNANNKKNGANIVDLFKLNYAYSYDIILDNNVTNINGKINETAEEFTCKNGNKINKFYRNKDGLYRLDNLKWVESNECSKFYKFYNLAYIDKMLEEATLDHNTSYKDGRVELSLLISINNINKIISDKTTDFSDDPSTITVSYDKEGTISGISYDLSSYCTNMKLCKKELKINLKYYDIGEVAKIDNPLE